MGKNRRKKKGMKEGRGKGDGNNKIKEGKKDEGRSKKEADKRGVERKGKKKERK